MNPNYKIITVFLVGFLLRILTNPWILELRDKNFSIHKIKILDSILFGCILGLTLILLDYKSFSNYSLLLWLILFITLIIIINYILNKQVFIDKKDLLILLREKYAETIKYSKIQLKNKNIDEELKKFLIIENEIKEKSINEINTILNKI
jgi:hypothetical protein